MCVCVCVCVFVSVCEEWALGNLQLKVPKPDKRSNSQWVSPASYLVAKDQPGSQTERKPVRPTDRQAYRQTDGTKCFHIKYCEKVGARLVKMWNDTYIEQSLSLPCPLSQKCEIHFLAFFLFVQSRVRSLRLTDDVIRGEKLSWCWLSVFPVIWSPY